MLGVSRPKAFDFQSNLTAVPAATVPGATVVGSATPHTKGSWTSLIDPVTYDSYGMYLLISNTGATVTRTDALIDIGIGPTGGGSEQVIVNNMVAGWRGSVVSTSALSLYLPIFVPAGCRVSARAQALQASKNVGVAIWLMQGLSGVSSVCFVMCDAYGANLATSGGTSVTPSASPGAIGTAVNMGSTLSRDYGAVLVVPQGTMSDTAMRNDQYHWWVRKAASGVYSGGWLVAGNASEISYGPFPDCPLDLDLPAGTQLQVAVECGTASGEPFDAIAYCFC